MDQLHSMDDCHDTHLGRRSSDAALATLTVQMSAMQADMGEIKVSMKDMAQAVTKLALIEERQVQSAQALERAFKVQEKHDSRLTAIEAAMVDAARTSSWVDRAVWAAATAAVVYVAAKSGLIK